jgi:hypothetical protein
MIRVWAKDSPFGTELADVAISGSRFAATGVAIGTEPVPYRLEYELATAERFVTVRLRVSAQGDGWRRALDLTRSLSGEWSCTTEAEGVIGSSALPAPGGDAASLAGALDCDLGLSPLTNSMPVLRHRLHEGGGPIDFVMAWVSVPDLSVHAAPQRYAFVREERSSRIVRFDSLDDPFTAEISFDELGMVVDYPGIARRIGQVSVAPGRNSR